MTTIMSNGSKWYGEAPDSIDKLLEVLKENMLDPRFVEHGNFIPSPERTPGTYSKYNSIDDRVDDLHYFTTHVKFGIGRATYDASQEIRSGDITREEGVALVKRYDGEFPERFFGELMEYLSLPAEQFPIASRRFEQPTMDRDQFLAIADRFRSPHLWQRINGEWKLRHAVWHNE